MREPVIIFAISMVITADDTIEAFMQLFMKETSEKSAMRWRQGIRSAGDFDDDVADSWNDTKEQTGF